MSGVFDDWRQGRAARRIRPGDGRALKPFRWWQVFSRSLLFLHPLGSETVYAIDVRHAGDATTGEIEASLYADGIRHSVSRLPAAFPVFGGTIEVAASTFGLRRCHYLSTKGEQQLEPDPGSAEGLRTRLDRAHPSLSRWIGIVAVGVLVVSLATLVPQLLEPVSRIPPVAENLGVFTSPVQLPFWLNAGITVGALVASTERALRMRYHWWLDGAAN